MLFLSSPLPPQRAHGRGGWSTATLPWPKQVGQLLASLDKLTPVPRQRAHSSGA